MVDISLNIADIAIEGLQHRFEHRQLGYGILAQYIVASPREQKGSRGTRQLTQANQKFEPMFARVAFGHIFQRVPRRTQ